VYFTPEASACYVGPIRYSLCLRFFVSVSSSFEKYLIEPINME
jgi:hypothetical protein